MSAIGAVSRTKMIPNGCGFLVSRPITLRAAREPAGKVTRVDPAGRELGVGEQGALEAQVGGDAVDDAPV
jgi:hypothetical protein